jgi:hypothetical protein
VVTVVVVVVLVVLVAVRAAADSFGCRISYRNSGIMGTETEKAMYTIPDFGRNEDSSRDAGHRMEKGSVSDFWRNKLIVGRSFGPDRIPADFDEEYKYNMSLRNFGNTSARCQQHAR